MSVLIKGMEMPKTCEACPFAEWSNIYQTSTCKFLSVYKGKYIAFDSFSKEYLTTRSKHCPLVEVPIPHGDLIDINNVKRVIEAIGLSFGVDIDLGTYPTVIESEE